MFLFLFCFVLFLMGKDDPVGHGIKDKKTKKNGNILRQLHVYVQDLTVSISIMVRVVRLINTSISLK